jgi:glycosyltransferase involved in cell wall biosynthesis
MTVLRPTPANPVLAACTDARRPSMLLVADTTEAGKAIHIARAFRSRGWQVSEIEISRYLAGPGSRHLNRIARWLFPRGKEDALATAVYDVATAEGVDLVLFAKAMGARPWLLEKLTARGIATACWYPDYHFEHPFVDLQAIRLFDLFVTTKAFQLDYLKSTRPGKRTVLVEHGYNSGVHYRLAPPVPASDRPYDCAFIGSYSPYKQQWLEAIVARLPDLKLVIVGDRWDGRTIGDPANVIINGPLIGDAMARVINHARIGLALHHGPGHNSMGWQDDVSARTFEIPACGTFMLHIDNAHVRTLFDVPGEIDTFEDADDAARKIRYWLDHAEEREIIAERCHRRAEAEFSYTRRGIAIAREAEAMLGIDRSLDEEELGA